jgi:hypothetical protein
VVKCTAFWITEGGPTVRKVSLLKGRNCYHRRRHERAQMYPVQLYIGIQGTSYSSSSLANAIIGKVDRCSVEDINSVNSLAYEDAG